MIPGKTTYTPRHILPKAVFHIFLLSAWLFYSPTALGQNTNISGVVNTYHRVIEILPSQSAVRVTNPGVLVQYNQVMIVQMKGASIQSANAANFGDTISLNNAGNYEIGTICRVGGDTVYLFYTPLNNYTIADKVQLVQIPVYYSATVTDTLKAEPWDSAAGTGGIIAISVDETLTLNAPISVDSAGYKGGQYMISGGACSNFTNTGYAYNGNTISPGQPGAYKGESIANLASSVTGGRGAPANGGGGGNNHNNGAGGGANLSAGGIGGGNWSSSGCTLNLQGRAGKALSSYGGRKIFFGGGGGAGHSNANLTPPIGGGHGGGIIFIQARTIEGNGHRISANGQAGGSAVSDGASGGGAGGTIIMTVDSYTGPLTLQALGGNGGVENDAGTLNRCYGSGGGGAGGALYFSASTPAITTSIAGGAAGVTWGSMGTCGAPILAGSGTNGVIVQNYAFQRSFTASSTCEGALPFMLLDFRATKIQKAVSLSWKVNHPEFISGFTIERAVSQNDWTPIAQVAAGAATSYQYTDHAPLPGTSLYRVKIIATSGRIYYSVAKKISFDFSGDLNLYPNPATRHITLSGTLYKAGELKITDASGRQVLSRKINPFNGKIDINLPRLPSGVYMIGLGEMKKKIIIRE